MKDPKSEALNAAVEQFGAGVVETVVSLVEMSDPDGAWALFQDQGMNEHAECVEFIYFDQD
jgi:hypothetical protein